MRHFIKPAFVATSLAAAFGMFGTASAQDASELGQSMTRFGAERAGNQEGTIPEYTGGLTLPSAELVDGWRLPNPFAEEEPIFRITAENMDQYADKLTEGQMHLLRTQPGYYMDIYPSHRTAAYPDHVLASTERNVTECSTLEGGLAIAEDCRGGIPFPLPQTGNEVMWNMLVAYQGEGAWRNKQVRSYSVDSEGRSVLTSELQTYTERPFWQLERDDRESDMITRVQALFTGPSREVGRGSGTMDFLNPVEKSRYAWSYSPGQRRVRRAPEFAYDTPNPASGGTMFFDEVFLFSGKMDRFDFEYIGKEEKFIPYNSYDIVYGEECSGQNLLENGHVNPACERWELHRVRVVEATLKPGMRHAYSKRRYYWDEDTLNGGLYEAWDQSGDIYRYGHTYAAPRYDLKIPSYAPMFVLFDFNRGSYYLQSDIGGQGAQYTEAMSERELQPSNFAGSGIR